MLVSSLVTKRAMRQWATALGLTCLVSCRNGGPRTLRDSEGRTFTADCKAGAPCKLTQASGKKREGMPAQELLLGSRLVGICDVEEGKKPRGPYDCRPLHCQDDRECPPLHDMPDGQCIHGHCSDPAEPLGVQDSVMLCLAGTGLGRETPQQIERYALALNCGTPCQIPAPCAQP